MMNGKRLFQHSTASHVLFKLIALAMESPLRRKINDPIEALAGSELRPVKKGTLFPKQFILGLYLKKLIDHHFSNKYLLSWTRIYHAEFMRYLDEI